MTRYISREKSIWPNKMILEKSVLKDKTSIKTLWRIPGLSRWRMFKLETGALTCARLDFLRNFEFWFGFQTFCFIYQNRLFLQMIISTGKLDACEKSSGPLGGHWKTFSFISCFEFSYFLKRLLKTNDTFQVVIPPTIEDTESSQDQANFLWLP